MNRLEGALRQVSACLIHKRTSEDQPRTIDRRSESRLRTLSGNPQPTRMTGLEQTRQRVAFI